MSGRPVQARPAPARRYRQSRRRTPAPATQMIAATAAPANHNLVRICGIVNFLRRNACGAHHVSDRPANPALTTAAPSTPHRCRFRISSRGRLGNNRADSDDRTSGHIRNSNAVAPAARDSSRQPGTPALPDRRTGWDRASRVRSRRMAATVSALCPSGAAAMTRYAHSATRTAVFHR